MWNTTIPKFPFDQARIWKLAASAGCGKTFQIVRAITDLIQERGVHPNKIMYLVFNTGPAEELKDKLEKSLSTFDSDKDAPWMGTHHAIARRTLKLHPDKILEGRSLVAWGIEHGFIFGTEEDAQGDRIVTPWDEVMSRLDMYLREGAEVPLSDPLAIKLLQALYDEEILNGRYTHTRYLMKAITLRLLPDVEYIFVDEGQDNCKLQFDLFDYIARHTDIKGLMIAGDDKQAINGWTGGRADLFLDFKADEYICLEKTYRCASPILNFANEIIKPLKKRSPVVLVPSGLGGRVERYGTFDWTMPVLRKLVKAGIVIYILVRARCFKIPVKASLKRWGLPYRSGIRERVSVIIQAMRVLASKSESDWTWDDLLPLLPNEEPIKGGIKKTAYWPRRAAMRFRTGEYSLEEEPDLCTDWLRFMGGDRHGINLRDFGFTQKFFEDIKNSMIRFPRGVWYDLTDEDIVAFEHETKEFGMNVQGIHVMTIHASKSSECDVAVLIRNITTRIAQTEYHTPDNERRVWYVGATRAKTGLLITDLPDAGYQKTALV